MAATARENDFAKQVLNYSDHVVWGLQNVAKERSKLGRYNRLRFVESLRTACTSLDETQLNLYLERNGL